MIALPWLIALAAAPPTDSILTLAAAAERVLAVHPRAQAAAAAVAGAEAGRREARSRWLPELTTSGSVTRFEEPMVVTPIHALDASQFTFDRTLIQGDLRLSFTVFDGGARSAGVRAAGAAAGSRIAAAQATDAGLLQELAGRYLSVLTAAAVLDAQQEGRDALLRERDRVERLVAEGAAARVDLLRVDAALAEAEAAVVEADASRTVAVRSLARALDLDTLTADRLRDVRPVPAARPPRDSLLARLLDASPELLEARSTLREAQAARRRARAAWFPRLDVQGAVVAYGNGDWEFSPEWQVGARVFYPLFTGGQRHAAVAQAGAREQTADARVRETEDRLAEELDRALAARDAATARVASLEASTTHLAEVARIEALALASGAGTQAEYLRAEAAARGSRAQLAAARATRVLADIDLARVTGDLSLPWLAANLETLP